MASQDRTATGAVELLRALQETPYRFGFLATVRRVDCLFPSRPRTGHGAKPADEVMRFGQEPSLAFAPATVAACEAGRGGRPPRLLVHFLGLLGPNGPLPHHLTEYARDRRRNADDPTFARFLDLFNHRILSLFYRAWASAQPAVHLDRPASDRFGTYIGAFAGLGSPSLRGRDAMPDFAKLHFAGRLMAPTRNAEGLAAILSEFFQLPVEIERFVGQWVAIPERARCRLGGAAAQCMLGTSTVLGASVWDAQQKFRIVIGPLRLPDYLRLLPGGHALRKLVAIVRNYIGHELAYDQQPILRRSEVPAWRLGSGSPGEGRLGWTTWLAGDRIDDASDLTLDPVAWEHWCAEAPDPAEDPPDPAGDPIEEPTGIET